MDPGEVVAPLDLDEDTVPSCRLGQHRGGAAAELAVGRAVTAPGASGGAGAWPAIQGVGGGLRGRTLVALSGDGGVGRARVAVAPGSVPFIEIGTVSCGRVRELPSGLLRVQGAVDGVRSGALRFVAVDAWLDARAVVVQSMAEQGSASLGHLPSVMSPLLRQCQGSIALLTSTISPSLFLPHINVVTVRHWSGSVKQLPSISLLPRVLALGAPVGVSGGGDLTAEIAYGNHPGIAKHDVAIHKKICKDVVYGRALVFDLRFAGEIWGFVFHRLASFSNPSFGLFTISRLRARGVGPVLTVTRILIPRRRPSSATCSVRFYYG